MTTDKKRICDCESSKTNKEEYAKKLSKIQITMFQQLPRSEVKSSAGCIKSVIIRNVEK